MKTAFVVIAFLLSGALTEGAGVSDSSGQVIARVNGETITVADMRSAFSRRHSGHLALLNTQFDKRWYLDSMIDNVLLIQEGYRLGLQNDEGLRRRTAEFAAAKAVELLLRREADEDVVPDDEVLLDVYNRYFGKGYKAALIRVSSRARAELIERELGEGADFAELAERYSEHPSAAGGGMIGTVRWGQLPPSLENALFDLAPGEVAGPVVTEEGAFFLRLLSVEGATPRAFDDVKEYIRLVMGERIREQRRREVVDALRREYEVRIVDGDWTHVASLPSDYAVATIGGSTAVTAGEWSAMVLERGGDSGDLVARSLLDEAVTRRVLTLEAQERGLDRATEVVEETTRFERQLVLERVNELIVGRISVGEKEARAYYEANREEFRTPGSVRLSHILVHTKELADSIAAGLEQGESFAALARQYSIDGSASSGGEIGVVSDGSIIEEFNDIVFALEPGAVSPVLKSRYGYHLFKVTERIPGVVPPYAEVADRIKKQLIEQKTEAERKRWIAVLRENAVIRVKESVLENLQF